MSSRCTVMIGEASKRSAALSDITERKHGVLKEGNVQWSLGCKTLKQDERQETTHEKLSSDLRICAIAQKCIHVGTHTN